LNTAACKAEADHPNGFTALLCNPPDKKADAPTP
jgi:hypothetical protein